MKVRHLVCVWVMVLAALSGIVRASTFMLSVTAVNGEVAISPQKDLYDAGEVVTLIPRPRAGFSFRGWSGDVTSKQLALHLRMDGDKTITANFATWMPPLGVPSPSFGIFETYRMYDVEDNRNPALTYRLNREGGYYTHYVDNTAPGATDDSNPYGTAPGDGGVPRRTIPNPLPEGSVLHVAGGPYSGSGSIWVKGYGTEDRPIFVRTTPGQVAPYFSTKIRVEGTYLILENIEAVCALIIGEYAGSGRDTHHVAVRNCNFYSKIQGGGGMVAGEYSATSAVRVDHAVFYACRSHDFGDIDSPVDQDYGPAAIGSRITNVWYVDNVMYEASGSGLQVISANSTVGQTAQYVYVGRNHVSRCRQSGIWAKYGRDIVFSQNTIENILHTSWSPSKGMGLQYGPQNVWYLANEVRDCVMGFYGPSTKSGSDVYAYVIGNLFHHLRLPAGYAFNPDDAYAYAAVTWYGSSHRYIIGNTFHDVPAGIHGVSGTGEYILVNNIFSQMTHGRHVYLYSNTAAEASVLLNNLFYQPSGPVVVRWGNVQTGDMDTLRSRTATGDGCLVDNPQFIDASVAEFYLQATSSAIDAGVESEVYQRFYDLYGIDIRRDRHGHSRPQGSGWDIGAHEHSLSAITDLRVSGASENSVTLGWTVPGQAEVTGTPTQYDLRYSGNPITETNWGVATPVQGEPVPGDFGQQQSFTIASLDPGTTYSFAIKMSNATGSASSALSNVIAGTTATAGNHAPVLTPIGDRSIVAGETLTFTVHGVDADGDALTYAAAGLPPGASFTTATRMFTWTTISSQVGIHHVAFQISDGQVMVSETITITVNQAPDHALEPDPIGDKSVDTPSSSPASATDATAPSLQAVYPAAGAVQVPVNPLIALTISDGETGIDAASVAIRVNDQLVYTGGESLYESAFGVCRRVGTRANYRYYYHPAEAFDFDQPVVMHVNASDMAGNLVTPASYQFVTEMRAFGHNESVSSGNDGSGYPGAATDSHGAIWAVWHAGQVGARAIYTAMRDHRTGYWSNPVQLTGLTSDHCNPVIAVGSDDTLYVAWQDNRRGHWDVYVSTCRAGDTWLEPVRVTDSDSNHTNPAIATDAADARRVFIAWEDDGAGHQDIYVASSDTGFASKIVTRITSDVANQTEPALTVGSDGTVYLVWTDQRNGTADIYGSCSVAASWANVPIVMGSGNQSHPALAVEPGTSRLHILWVDDSGGDLDVAHGVSEGLLDGPVMGRTIIDDTTNADQFAPTVVCAKDRWSNPHVYACWQDNRSMGGSQDSDVYFVEIRSTAVGTNILVGDDGTNSSQMEPVVTFDKYGQPAILWADGREGTPQIYGACTTYCRPNVLASKSITRSAGGRVGVDPRAVNDPNDVSIMVQSDACACEVVLSIAQIENVPSFASPCIAGFEIGPSGVQFSFPATVTIPYADSASGQAVPYWYDAQTGTLSQRGISEITSTRLANGMSIMSFKTTHLTPFYILEGASSRSSVRGGGGCALASHGGAVGPLECMLPYVGVVVAVVVWRHRDRKARLHRR